MRLVHVHGGVLQIRWTWLPFWLAVHPQLMADVDRELRDCVLLGGVTTAEEDLEAMHEFVIRRVEAHFPAFEGLGTYLRGVCSIQGAPEAV